ncbi:MAG: aldolase/citrate lyase family protein, partial [Halobacteriales archaeon]|nr:aldolase/citrate lyase family protein [Halobacteriales archaeon]
NIVVPRVQTAAEVRRAVRAAYFEYDGGPGARGLSQGKTSDYGAAYTKDGDVDYVTREDDTVLVGVLIEDIEAVENLDEILDVPQLGFVFPGPGDLGVSMGKPLEYGDPEVKEHIAAIRDGCVERGIPVLGVHGSNFVGEEETKAEIENGYQLVSLGNDFKALREVVSDRRSWFE